MGVRKILPCSVPLHFGRIFATPHAEILIGGWVTTCGLVGWGFFLFVVSVRAASRGAVRPGACVGVFFSWGACFFWCFVLSSGCGGGVVVVRLGGWFVGFLFWGCFPCWWFLCSFPFRFLGFVGRGLFVVCLPRRVVAFCSRRAVLVLVRFCRRVLRWSLLLGVVRLRFLRSLLRGGLLVCGFRFCSVRVLRSRLFCGSFVVFCAACSFRLGVRLCFVVLRPLLRLCLFVCLRSRLLGFCWGSAVFWWFVPSSCFRLVPLRGFFFVLGARAARRRRRGVCCGGGGGGGFVAAAAAAGGLLRRRRRRDKKKTVQGTDLVRRRGGRRRGVNLPNKNQIPNQAPVLR